MKYKCKDCGKIYEQKPMYCECGNDSFNIIRTKAEIEAQNQYQEENDAPQEEKTNIWAVLFTFIIVVGIVFFIRQKMANVEKAPEFNDAYLTSVREKMMEDFDPSGITNSGYCIVSFEINSEGWIQKRQFVKRAPIEEINNAVFEMLKHATIVDKPPKAYTNVPISLEFGCMADEMEVSCYSKNIVKSDDMQR